MTYRKLVNKLVFVISILLVNLVTTIISDQGMFYLKNINVARATLIGMGVSVFFLFPAFTYINGICEKITKHFFKAGKNAAGNFFGILLAVLVLLFLLFLAYLKVWFNIWFWQINWETTQVF